MLNRFICFKGGFRECGVASSSMVLVSLTIIFTLITSKIKAAIFRKPSSHAPLHVYVYLECITVITIHNTLHLLDQHTSWFSRKYNVSLWQNK